MTAADAVLQVEALGSRHLRLRRHPPLATVTLDRPRYRNALTPAMYRGVRRAIELSEHDPDVHALVITGTGDVFAPGGDLGNPADDEHVAHHTSPSTQPFEVLRETSVPIVAAVNGHAHAGGLLVALLADVTVASEQASFRTPELLRGFPELWLAAVLPAHVGVAMARDLMLTARTLSAAEALALGLVSRVVPHGDLLPAAEQAALEMLDAEPYARRLVKQALNARYGAIDRVTFEAARELPGVEEGFQAFIEKRPPVWAAAKGRPRRR